MSLDHSYSSTTPSPHTQPLPLRSAMKHSSSSATSPESSPVMAPLRDRRQQSPPVFSKHDSSILLAPTPPEFSALPSPSIATMGYTPKVSFDTFENPAASMFSFTLQVKSEGYRRTRGTRIFLCASSPDESGREALDWALESLVQDGDELVVFRGVDQEELEKDHDLIREEAREMMRKIQDRSAEVDSERKLSLILEYIPGRVMDTIDRLIALYRPDSLVVGTRGRKTWQNMGIGMGMGSVSKYCLSHSPVPIIVVRPESKVKKTMEKRRADPKRGKHFE